jgi:hypothetical protein
VSVPATSDVTGPLAQTSGPLATLDARDPDARAALHWLADRLDANAWTQHGMLLRDVARAYADESR